MDSTGGGGSGASGSELVVLRLLTTTESVDTKASREAVRGALRGWLEVVGNSAAEQEKWCCAQRRYWRRPFPSMPYAVSGHPGCRAPHATPAAPRAAPAAA